MKAHHASATSGCVHLFKVTQKVGLGLKFRVRVWLWGGIPPALLQICESML